MVHITHFRGAESENKRVSTPYKSGEKRKVQRMYMTIENQSSECLYIKQRNRMTINNQSNLDISVTSSYYPNYI